MWFIIGIFLGLLMIKLDKVSAKLSSSPNHCGTVAEEAMKHLVFMYHEAMSISLGSKNVLTLVFFGLSIFKLSMVNNTKYLGVQVDDQLKWSTHLSPAITSHSNDPAETLHRQG